MKTFDSSLIKKLWKPETESSGEDNGLVTVIGGSKLFHGAPILSLKVASRIVDMVFFATPEKSVGYIAEKVKSKLNSFIWIPWEEVESYIEKSDSVLIGPGFMRYAKESKNVKNKLSNGNHDHVGLQTREITKKILLQNSKKRFVIDAGSLQVMDPEWIPENAIITPNRKEFEILFNINFGKNNINIDEKVSEKAKKYNCTIVLKGPETIVCSPDECILVKGGNPGMTKGGTGDVLAGLTVSLLAKNDSFLAASAASYIAKTAADELYKKVGTSYNADDLANKIPEMIHRKG